ncbi:uncharacterized protein N7500_010391 [Penicillium coprophilum]|uniref:uncharacterized protein n=1 Tax=Penicillium coprophilum TaxID=36646 RepID=UPI0023A2FAE7|nr:uncharacterized protein N7500_010391 [Penicillium coprophilum]KAJ5154952.1 hypothetical protein N7500_010391 [Penicillium coprophilum]
MQSPKQPNEVTANKISRPVTPLQQTSKEWELGNVPVAPGFHKADEDEQLDVLAIPQIQITDTDLNITYPFNPCLPKLSQWLSHQNTLSHPRPRELLLAFSPKKKPSQSRLSDSSTYGSASSDDWTTDKCELIRSTTYASFIKLHLAFYGASSFNSEKGGLSRSLGVERNAEQESEIAKKDSRYQTR